jgi:hypothetical protein
MQKGFTPIIIVLAVFIIAAIAGGIYYFGFDHGFEKSITQTSQFSPTPTLTENIINWQTYVNKDKQYSIQFPPQWNVKTSDYEDFIFENEKPQECLAYCNQPSRLSGYIRVDSKEVSKGDFFNPKSSYWPKLSTSSATECGPVSINTDIKEVQVGAAKAMVQLSQPACNYEGAKTSHRQRLYRIPTPSGIKLITIQLYYDSNYDEIDKKLTQFDQILSTFKFLDQARKLKPADAQIPTSGICSEPSINETVTITLGIDSVPQPRCTKVTSNQKLKIINDSSQAISGTVGQYTINIVSGQNQTINQTFDSYLESGVHSIVGAEIWLQK